MFRSLFLLAVFAASPSLYAKGYSPAVTAQPGGYAVKFASNGTPLAVPASNVVGGVGATAPSKLTLPGGIDYPFTATSIIATGAMLTPWGSAISIAIAAGSIGVAVLDAALANAKLRIKPNGGGIEQSDSAVCTTEPCYAWATNSGALFATPDAACANYNPPGTTAPRYSVVQGADASCYAVYYGSPGSYMGNVYRRNIPVREASYVPISTSDASALMAARSPTQQEVQALVDLGFPPELAAPVLTGPPSVFKGNIVQLGLDGTVTEIEERYIASFQPGVIGIGVEKKQTVTTPAKTSSTITTNPDGSTTTAVTTTPKTSSTLTTTAQPEPVAVTCGLPGTPACKLDETGTPSPVTAADYPDQLKKLELDRAASIPAIAATSDKSFFEPLRSLFVLPPVVSCQPFVLPRNMGAIDPCPVADGMRLVMGYIWALGALFLSLRMIREVI